MTPLTSAKLKELRDWHKSRTPGYDRKVTIGHYELNDLFDTLEKSLAVVEAAKYREELEKAWDDAHPATDIKLVERIDLKLRLAKDCLQNALAPFLEESK